MNIRNELILRAISSFCGEGDIANFTYSNMNAICKNDAFKEYIKPLIEDKLIENLTTPGYCSRFKVNTKLECPDFLFKKLTIQTKEYMLKLWKEYQEFGDFKNRLSSWDARLKVAGITDDDIINAKFVTNTISSEGTLELTDLGYRIVTKKEIMQHYCVYCGETDPTKFYKDNKTMCKECTKKLSRNTIPLEEKLLKRSKSSARSRHLDHNLDVKYIKDLLQKQNNKCYYTQIPFQDNFSDKLTYPTIDRIDSTKGYIKGNVCICTFYINMAKNNLDIYTFKKMITLLHKNINNF